MTLPMRQLGRTGLSISTVGLAGWTIDRDDAYPLGPTPSTPRQLRQTLRRGIAAGVNWIDTAGSYGMGTSETSIGRVLAELPENDRPYVFTKGGVVWDASNPGAPPSSILRPSVIRAQCEESLTRLGVDTIDLYQFHWPDELGTPVEESWEVMQGLIAEGKVRYGGLSGFPPSQIERCEAVAHVDAVQDQLSLLDRHAAWDVLPLCETEDIGFLAWGVLGSGRLCEPAMAGLASPTTSTRRHGAKPGRDGRHRTLPLLRALQTLAHRHGCTVPAVAVAWTLSWPGVSGAVVGAGRPGEIEDVLQATDVELTGEDFSELAAALAAACIDEGPALPYPGLEEWGQPAGSAVG